MVTAETVVGTLTLAEKNSQTTLPNQSTTGQTIQDEPVKKDTKNRKRRRRNEFGFRHGDTLPVVRSGPAMFCSVLLRSVLPHRVQSVCVIRYASYVNVNTHSKPRLSILVYLFVSKVSIFGTISMSC